MRTVGLLYGSKALTIDIPAHSIIANLVPNPVEQVSDELAELHRALANPIGTHTLIEMASGKRNAAIVVSDITRPLPREKMLPIVLDELNRAGIKDENITVIFGLGTHRHHTRDEQIQMVGQEVFERVRCIDSQVDETIRVGETSRGTPVDLFTEFEKAEFKMCCGEIELHYYAGYTGGAKAVLPGVSSKEAIQKNHRMMTWPGSNTGVIDGNPVREDMEEAAKIAGLDFVLNVVLESGGRIIQAFAGDFVKAHREGAKLVDQAYKIEIPEKADIVLVSAGGHPKDISLYQAHKAIENARYAVREGGTIIVVAECSEGIGHNVFSDWIHEAHCPEHVINRLNKEFVFGGHKAVALARVSKLAEVILVSELSKELTEKAFLQYSDSLQSAWEYALRKHGKDATVITMPYGYNTLPVSR